MLKPANLSGKCSLITASAVMLMSFLPISPVFAKGGDNISPFPKSDPLTLKQEAKGGVVDSAGNIIVAGYTNNGGMNNDFQVTKFNSDGSGVAWRATFDKSGGDDQATAVAVDSSDNVIVTGNVWNVSNMDIQTIKYNGSTGAVLWQHTWSGAAGGADIATSITVDASDNIYVAGYTANASGNDDYLVLKYPAAGSLPAWQEIYNSAYNSNDRIASITAGVDGIAVTGASSKGGIDFDILTLKYDFDKSLIWEQRRAGASNGDDMGIAVKMDSSGNVIVAGYLNNGINPDIITIKYSASGSGAALWEKVYNGGGSDEPKGLWIDDSGDIFVTGYTTTYGGNEDFYTVRYSAADGAKVWESNYDSGSGFTDIPVGIVLKNGVNGGVFVTGYTITNINSNITTLKYSKATGALLWQKSFNGADNMDERPVGVGLTPAGDVCVAGWSNTLSTSYDFVALKYDSGPVDPPTSLTATATSNSSIALSWIDNSSNEDGFTIQRKLGEAGTYAPIATVGANVTLFSDAGLLPDSYYYYRVMAANTANGDSYYTNEAHALTKVVSYDAPSWVYTYNSADNLQDEATGIVVGADEHPVVTGFSNQSEDGVPGSFSFDYMTIKLDRSDKSVKWKALYDSGDGGTDLAAGITIDGNGDAVVTGTAYLSGGSDKSDDLYTIKYSSAGHVDPLTSPLAAWGAQYGTQAGIDQATAIQAAKDSSNNIVVIGHGININNDEDMFIIKYRPDGTTPWAPIVYDGPAHGNDYPSAVAFDKSGNIFITGSTENAAGNFDIFTAKYSGSTGGLIWSQIYAGAGNGDDHGLSLSVDSVGDVYITGSSVNAAGNEEWVTIKYAGADSSSNREIWRRVHNGSASPVNGNDRGIAVAIDPVDEAVVVAGTSYISLTDSDFHLIRYSAADGSVIWERNFDKPSTYDYVTAMAIDSSGYIYLAGNSRNGLDSDHAYDSSSDLLSLIYDFEGTFIGATQFNGMLSDEAGAIAVNNLGEAFIAGATLNSSGSDYLVVKQKNNYILVPAPFTPVPQADSGKINLSWGANTPGTQFQVDRTLAPVLPASSWSPVTTASAGSTSFQDSALLPGTGYCYRIYAFTGSLNSRTITSCATTTLVPSTLSLPVVDSMTQISLSWSQVADNTGYKVERKTGAGGAWGEIAVRGAGQNSYIDSSLVSGTTYFYRIYTLSQAGSSLPSNEQNATTKPSVPLLNPPSNITNSQMLLSWSSVTGASSYTLQYKLSGGTYANVAACTGVTGASCVAAGLAQNSSYTFQVKASTSGGDSVWSNETGASAQLAVPEINTIATPTTTTLTLVWGYPGVPGADITAFVVDYKIGAGGVYSTSACPQDTSQFCYLSGLTPNRNYYFRVKARNAFGDSAWSNEQITLTAMPPTTLTSATALSQTQTLLTWTAVPEATVYHIQRAACKYSDSDPVTCRGNEVHPPGYLEYESYGNYIDVLSPATSYTDSGLLAGTNYRYRVYAAPGTWNLTSSNELNVWTALSPPVLSIIPASSTALNLSWNPSLSGESNYTVEVSTTGSGGAYSAIPAATAMPMNSVAFGHTGLSLATEYCYRVKAYSTEAAPPATAYSNTVCKTTPPNEPALSAATNQYESSFTVLQDASKYWSMGDYWIDQPVVITSGGNTYTKLISGSVNSAFYASPAFATETINAGDSYVILQAVFGKATGNVSASSLLDADKNWGMYEWNGYKVKITNSVNSANIGQVLDIVALGTVDVYTSTNFPVPIVSGDSYQMASYFGTTVGSGSSATSMVDTSNTWGKDWTQGYYLMMTSGRNNGHARKITGKTATTLTVNEFPFPVTQGDTYLIAPTARVAPGFGTAESGSSATTLVDTAHVWRGVGVGFYLQMTSGSNKDKARIITVFDNSSAKTITVSPAFDSPILPGDSYMIVPTQQFGSYFGTAAGSPGNSSSQLVDSANSWLSDWTQGYFLMMTSGSNSGQMRTITAKTATTLDVSPPFANNISSTDAYLIGQTDATKGSGTITTTVAPGLPYKGTAKLTLTNGEAEFYSLAPGFANNYNYELLGLKDLTQLAGNFDAQFDYNILSGLLPADSTLSYLYLANSYASSRFDFQSPNGKTYNTYIQRGRIAVQDNGRSTAFSLNMDRLYDTRTMDNDLTPWKSWAVDQWKDYYLQMTSGPNNQLVRKVIANTANSITLESPFPSDPSARTGTAATSGNSNTKLVDSTVSNWTVNQWQNYYLYISSGANAGQTLKIVSSDASSVTVGGSGFTSSISGGDSYKIFNISGDAYRINVIAGSAAINGSTQSGKNSTNALLVDSSDNIGTTLPAKNWGINQWQNFYLYITSGPNIGQFRTVTANTANSISVNPPFQYQLASGDSYSILDPRAAAQAVEAYWVSIYEPATTVTEQLIIPAGDTSGRMRFSKSGDNLQFYTAATGGAWQLRRELNLKTGNTFTPKVFWIYQLGRLPHAAGTVEQTKISNFQLTTNPLAATNLSFSSFKPEVGHFFRRSDELPVLTTNLFDISWNKIDTATLYEVERCLSADHQNPASRTVGTCTTFTQSQPLDGTTRIVNAASSSGLTAGYTYRFRVRAKYNATDYTAWSNEEWITVTPPAPTLNSPASGTATASQLTVTWNNVAGDNGYKLFWKERSGASCTDADWNGPIVTAMNSVSYTHSGLGAGTFYCYKVSAAGPVGPPQTADSAFSGIVSQTTKPVAPVLNSLTGVTASKIDLSWGNVTGNTGYKIERKAAGDTLWTNIYNTSTNLSDYSDTTVAPGTLYYYRLSANSGSGYSALSNEQSTTTAPAITVVTASVVSAGQINVSWPLVQGATNYKIARKDGTGSYGQIDNQVITFSQLYCGYVYPSVGCLSLTPVVNTYMNVSLASNTTYCYMVTAWNNTGGDGAASVEKCVATLNIPAQNLVATAVNSFKVRLDWTPMTCSPSCGTPESYEIERLVRDGNWVKIATVVAAQTTFTDRIGIDPLKQYRYRVRSISGIGGSPYSEAVTYTPPFAPGDNVGP